jgi:signal transduction histidine kinase/DNA-binding response OmpR family regulator/L-asparagine transporter-like permease
MEGLPRPHPRAIGWLGTAALAMGGSNQSLFLIGALFAGQGDIPGQGSASLVLLAVGLLLSYAAAPGWIELVLMSPDRVGGIAAVCTDAFRPYSKILSVLTGVCYWWGWVPTCGLTALFSAGAIHAWVLPGVATEAIACLLVVLFVGLNLLGIRWVTRVSIPLATVSASLALISMVAPALAGKADWARLGDLHLNTPFPGWFGGCSSLMAGLYLVGFAAPAFEAATCHVGETRDWARNVPRAVLAAAIMAAVYFVGLPVVWFCALGSTPLTGDLSLELGPTFAPLLGAFAKSAAIWFIMFNMFHGTIQPLAGAARTLMQLSEDGVLPRFLGLRSRQDVPWPATLATAGFAIVFLLAGDPIWLVAAANFSYLIGICLPNVAVWLLRRDAPDAPRPWRAPPGTIALGLAAALGWFTSTLLGFQQFGLPTIVFGLAMAYSGAALFVWRRIEDRVRQGLKPIGPTLHFSLTGAMLLVLLLDATGYIAAVHEIPSHNLALIAALEDIFVVVAILSITVGIVMPGVIAHRAGEVNEAARRLASGILHDLSTALAALGRGNLEGARIHAEVIPVTLRSRDELGAMAESFNEMQAEVQDAAAGLEKARDGLRAARDELTQANEDLRHEIRKQEMLAGELIRARDAAEAGSRAKAEFLATISHELRTPLNGVIGMSGLLLECQLDGRARRYAETLREAGDQLLELINDLLDFSKLDADQIILEEVPFAPEAIVQASLQLVSPRAQAKALELGVYIASDVPPLLIGDPGRLRQVLLNLLSNAVKFTEHGAVSLEARRLPEDGEYVALEFVIRDTGIGIAAADLPRLFREFSQIDSSISRRYGGTGLGLAICRKLVARMDGEIDAESEIGRGSRFRFTARFKASENQPNVPDNGRARLGGSRVLVVDDNELNCDVFMAQLGDLGADVHVIGDPQLAQEALRHAADEHRPFDAALLDHVMPDLDGESLGRAIRADPHIPPLRLVLATSTMMGAAEQAELSGVFHAVLIKPVAPSTLGRALADLSPSERARLRRRAALAGPGARTAAASAPRVLVAEDNLTNQAVIRAYLDRLGLRADVVGNGVGAVEAMRTHPYELVLMDVMMPEMDGVTATRQIRRLPGDAARALIVALTANASPRDHADFQAAGMDLVLTKPVSFARVSECLAELGFVASSEAE